jgi:predicted transcriptional regulator
MIETLLGNRTAENVLLYIVNYGEGHTSGISQTFNLSKSQVHKQLTKLENAGILVARNVGNLRMFQINPRCLYKNELETLLEKILSLLPDNEIEKYFRQRRRPRRTGKKL